MTRILSKGRPSDEEKAKKVQVVKNKVKYDVNDNRDVKKFSLNIPRLLHIDFRTKCSREDTDMRAIIIEAMIKYVTE